jgi:antitoxin ParD1/3/4
MEISMSTSTKAGATASTSTTTSVNISMPEVIREIMKQRMAAGGYENASEYVRHLIREDLKRASQEKLEQELLEGEASGPAEPWDARWLDGMKARLAARLREKQS